MARGLYFHFYQICIQFKTIHLFILPWFASSLKLDQIDYPSDIPGIVAYENRKGNRRQGWKHAWWRAKGVINTETHTHTHILFEHSHFRAVFSCRYVTSILCLQWPSTTLSCCWLHVCDIVCPWASGSVCSSVSVMYRCAHTHTHTTQPAREWSASLERSFIIFIVKSNALVMRLMLSSTKQSWARPFLLLYDCKQLQAGKKNSYYWHWS